MKDLLHEFIIAAQNPLATIARSSKTPELFRIAAQKVFTFAERLRFHIK